VTEPVVAIIDVTPEDDALVDEDVMVVVDPATTRFAATCELSLAEIALLAAFLRKHVPGPAPFVAPTYDQPEQ